MRGNKSRPQYLPVEQKFLKESDKVHPRNIRIKFRWNQESGFKDYDF